MLSRTMPTTLNVNARHCLIRKHFQFSTSTDTLNPSFLRKNPLEAGIRQADKIGVQVSRACDEEGIRQADTIAQQVGVRLTRNELTLLRDKLDPNGKFIISQANLQHISQQALQQKVTREICLGVVCSSESSVDKLGVRTISLFDYLGTGLFAVVGTQVAGDCGMNIIGCGLVGCSAALGGGTLNAMMYGGTTNLLNLKTGVRWVAQPGFLAVAIIACICTFYGWPYYCEQQADHYIDNVFGRENLDDGGDTVSEEVFLKAWKNCENFRQTIRDALPKLNPSAYDMDEGHFYFSHIDSDGSGDIDRVELRSLVQHRFYNGIETYALETLGLSSLSIAAVSMSIKLGLHPLVAATSGVTVCFGGILRDLLCGRDLAIGSQSYAFATGASSTTYVLLRELSIRRMIALPLAARSFLSVGMCILLRSWEYQKGEPLLGPMHGR